MTREWKRSKKPKMADAEVQTVDVEIGEVIVDMESLTQDQELSETLEPLKKE